MKSKQYSIPVGMVTQRFYCNRCGELLTRVPKTRILTSDDSDINKRRRTGKITGWTADEVELTEFDFHCTTCDRTVTYKEQCAIEHLQKQEDRHILTQSEIDRQMFEAEEALERKRKIKMTLWVAAGVIWFLVMLCYGQGK